MALDDIGTDLGEQALETGIDRRGVLRALGASAASTALAGAVVAGGLTLDSAPTQAQTITDTGILNFALNLEYLEAEFYVRAFFGYGLQGSDVTGTGTDGTGVGTPGTVTGGSQVPFKNPAIQQYCQLLTADELTHVRFLKAALGSAAVAEPSIDLSTSFTELAQTAGLITSGQTFNPFADDVSFLLGAYIFEDVGVTAYNGAATLITNPAYLRAAASILAVEAYHAGMIRTLLANIGAGQAANAISALRAKLSGAQDDQGIIVPGNSYNAVSTDSNALAFTRTPAQVLSIVYGGGPTGQAPNIDPGGGFPSVGGLFFPRGLNGTIR